MAKKLEISIVENDNQVDQLFELNAEIVAGSLTSNAKELKEKIENELKNYSVDKYIENPDIAKSDKALLNKVKEAVASKRKEITNAWNQPLDEFLDEMKSLEKSISNASDKINEIVKEAENKEKTEKRNWIENYWKTLDFNIVSLDKIFNPKWLNKTYKNNQIMLDCENLIEKITTELTTINSMADEDKEILKSFYIDTLDLNATLKKGNQLKENREKLKAVECVKILEETKLIPEQNNEQKHVQNPDVNNVNDPVMTYTLTLCGTKSKLFQLRKYMDSLGITYIKV